jgi:8-amino-7-oxononanoate synthase
MDWVHDGQYVTSALLSGRAVTGPAAARITIDGREYINFFGTGYLALTGLLEVRGAVRQLLDEGAAFCAQMPAALGAIDPVFERVERSAAAACGTAASLYFASGYLIGMVGLASLSGSFDLIAVDERAHASLKDAAKLTGLPSFTYPHCDAGALSAALKQRIRPHERPVVVTDGVFPMTGRVPPLAEYVRALEPYAGRLFVDESHGFGVVGRLGRGSAEHCGIESFAIRGATLTKAYCSQGAILACTAAVAERLRSMAPIRGACAGSPLSAAGAAASLAYVAENPAIRERLSALSEYLRGRLRSIGLEVIDSPAPIVSFQWGSQADMEALQRRLFQQGIHLYYTTCDDLGPAGLIRCAVFRDHTRADIDALVSALD